MKYARRVRWELTSEAFDGFLARLDADRERAGAAYQDIRRALVIFFRFNGCTDVDGLADEALDRAVRRSTEIDVVDVHQFVRGIARHMVAEVKRAPRPIPLEDLPEIEQIPSSGAAADLHEQQLRCLDVCAKGFAPEMRALVLDYYDATDVAANRKRIAQRFGISTQALRVRAFRARRELESCLRRCLGRRSTF
jgi:DNA-directed RNA polymerase specialized sigma24 family protein